MIALHDQSTDDTHTQVLLYPNKTRSGLLLCHEVWRYSAYNTSWAVAIVVCQTLPEFVLLKPATCLSMCELYFDIRDRPAFDVCGSGTLVTSCVPEWQRVGGKIHAYPIYFTGLYNAAHTLCAQ